MKTTAIIMFGFFSLSLFTACKCEPEDEETSNPKENSAQNDAYKEDSEETENDTVSIKR